MGVSLSGLLSQPVFKRVALVALLPMVVLSTGGKWGRLEADEQMHFRALQVFMDKDIEKEWLKLKERSDRDAYLKQLGIWDKFYQYDEAEQQAILSGAVKLGWHRDQVFMAFGPPQQKERMAGREATRSERLTYRFEVDKEGTMTPLGRKKDYKAVGRMQLELIVDDDYVMKMDKKDDWD